MFDLQASQISRSRLGTAGSSFISASHAEYSPRPEMIGMSNTGIRDMNRLVISVADISSAVARQQFPFEKSHVSMFEHSMSSLSTRRS